GNSVRANSHASGTPNNSDTTVATVAVASDSHSAASTPGSVNRPPNSDQGVLANSPANGRTKKATPISAGRNKSQGGRPAPAPRSGRAESGAGEAVRPRPDGPAADVLPAPVSARSSWCVEPRFFEDLGPRPRQHQLHPGLGRSGGPGRGKHPDRVFVDRLLGL